MTKIEKYLIKKRAKEQLELYVNGSEVYHVHVEIKPYDSVQLSFATFSEEARKVFIRKLLNELKNIAKEAVKDLENELNEMRREVETEIKEILK
ncbi:hypothetical protein [Paraclostridium dentum]|uniref:hypothetical protein n=1 Tax=Paraclostridium dentum TaxID=2662455 RepID=UPI003464D6BD